MKVQDLKLYSEKLLAAYGVPKNEASVIVESLIKAELRGISSHGFMRLPIYIKRTQAGIMRAAAEMTIVHDNGASAVLDANFSFGQVAAQRGMQVAIEKAHQYSIGTCLVKNSGHFGTAANYGEMAAAEKMVGIVLSNTTPLMPPTGGAEKKLGNNPLAIVAPTKGDPVIVDMALSAVAMGKLLVAKSKGEKIPLDWGTDKNGTPSDDPQAVLDGGLLLPMAGPKGYSLAVAIEILTGILAGTFAWQIPSLYNLNQKQSVSHLFVALNISSFTDYGMYLENIEAFKLGLKASGKAPGVAEIYLPGEIEQNKAKATNEIKLPANVLTEINELAKEVNIGTLE